jgi:soluble lytic murein transglycosylase-like protein
MAMPLFAASVPTAPVLATVVRADAKTGRLVRNVVATNSPQRSQTPQKVNDIIDRIAEEQGVEAPLVHSVVRAESNYNTNAVSPKGALGLMQLIPSTARRFGVSNAFDAEENISGGVRYLKFLLDYYQGDYPRAIAAYNAGEGAVDKFKGIPPYAETRNYVWQVAKNLKTAREKQAKSPLRAQSKPADVTTAALSSETPRPVQTSLGSDGRVYYRTP